ncbi:MAG: cytochrome b5-like heme/steroid binding domain-containing protein [bacterium]
MFNFYKILRATAWLLTITTLVFLLSGFLMVKFSLTPWLDYSTSRYIHLVLTPILFVPLFYLHSLTGTISLLSRHNSLNKRSFKIITGIIWTAILVLCIFLYYAPNPQIPSPAINATSTADLTLTTIQIAKHNTAGDCWIIINNKVYSIANYLSTHPGGRNTITPYCGKEATQAFIGLPHSQYASSLLAGYYVGDLGK